MRIAWVILLLALTGCATYWNNPNGTSADFSRDSYACERDAGMVPGSPATPGHADTAWGNVTTQTHYLSAEGSRMAEQERLFDSCMGSKGWTKQGIH